MKETMTLKHPIDINGKKVKALVYDTDEITGQMFIEADSRLQTDKSSSKTTSTVGELDRGLHLYLGFAAVIAVNPEIDYSDLLRLKGVDVLNIVTVGRGFFFSSSEEPSEEELLEGQSEHTAESTTPQKKK